MIVKLQAVKTNSLFILTKGHVLSILFIYTKTSVSMDFPRHSLHMTSPKNKQLLQNQIYIYEIREMFVNICHCSPKYIINWEYQYEAN